ncbi:MAG: cupin domain-containing protein, partial [Bacteroidota bacterium]|nr:cupin domain-containing protein [Bacteroidota bacterium]
MVPFNPRIPDSTDMPDFANSKTVSLVSWDDIPMEQLSPTIGRKLVSGDGVMVAHVYLDKGAIVPKHQHHNEQVTYILSGTLRFFIGEDESEVIDVHSGQVLHIPSNVWHKAEALEDTLAVDVCSPPRGGWVHNRGGCLRGWAAAGGRGRRGAAGSG